MYFTNRFQNNGKGCKWKFEFKAKTSKISTLNDEVECRFVNSVFADGNYLKKSGKNEKCFIDEEENKVSFKTIMLD